MIAVEEGPRIGVVVPSGLMARYMVFELDLASIYATPGSQLMRTVSPSIARNCNQAVRIGLQQGFEYFHFPDDDQSFDSDMLLRLVGHKLPFVSAWTVAATPPFMPITYSHEGKEPDGSRTWMPVAWTTLDGRRGLMQVHSIGRSGNLVHRSVYEKIPDPWYQVGQINPEELQEDTFFCDQLRKVGIPIIVDLDCTMGHISPVAAWPWRDPDGTWCIMLEWPNKQRVKVPRAELKGPADRIEVVF